MTDEEAKAVQESAKAVQESAKAAGKAIDAARELGPFVAKHIDGPIEQASAIVTNELAYIRWSRALTLKEKVERRLAKLGHAGPTRAVPLKLAVPILQRGSLEEDDELQDRWAALLTNAADANFHHEIRRAFVSILEDLTSQDVAILEKIYSVRLDDDPHSDVVQEIWTVELPHRVTTVEPKGDGVKRPPPDVEVSIGNLVRLGLVTASTGWGGMQIFGSVHHTVLGREFVRSCSIEGGTTPDDHLAS